VFPETGKAWFEIRPEARLGERQLHLRFDQAQKFCPLVAPSESLDVEKPMKRWVADGI
jgi:hypothetical protein